MQSNAFLLEACYEAEGISVLPVVKKLALAGTKYWPQTKYLLKGFFHATPFTSNDVQIEIKLLNAGILS
jgi:hypothetical protein